MSSLRLKCLALLLLFGAGRLHFEQNLTQDQRAAHLNAAQINIAMRQRLGQMGFLAALSGFRAVVADFVWIQAHSAWERTEWGRMSLLFDTVTSLQPRAELFWDVAAWHMAWNASVAARDDRSQPRETLRIKAQREYFRLGEDFLLRGIQNNPQSAVLHDHLGLLYVDKFGDHARAAAAYEKCSQLPRAPSYVHRLAAYELSKVPGREGEAYSRLRALYEKGPSEHVPTLLRLLPELEEKLNVPPAQRIHKQ